MKLLQKTALILSLALALTACSGQNSSSGSSEPSSAAEQATETSAPETTATSVETTVETSSAPEAGQESYTSEIISVKTFDGLTFDGKLRMPSSGKADKIVLFANGSGPNTYDNRRESGELKFNYYDLFAKEFTDDGTAFFSYNTRGITPGENPPMFYDMDLGQYKTYIPNNEVQDLETMIRLLKEDERLKDAKVYLLGWSAGTITAPLVALRGNVQVDALLLAGYCNRTMEEILDWQQTGYSSMVFYRQYFDENGDGIISKEEFDKDPAGVAAALQIKFEDADANGDQTLTAEDFALLLEPTKKELYAAIENKDDTYLLEQYGVALTSDWFWDYRTVAPNSETLPKLDLPIYIFQGQYDANTPAEDSQAIEKSFQDLGKTNLKVSIFPGADHDLNYTEYVVHGTIPEGIQAIFDTVAGL